MTDHYNLKDYLMNDYIKYRTFIPAAPIPLIGDLFKLLYHKNQFSNTSMVPWCNQDQDIYLFSRGAWAIAAIVNWYSKYIGHCTHHKPNHG